MPYYRGDYVAPGRGGYYRGDPFLGALVGGLARSVGLGKVVAKAGRWVAQRVTGKTVKAATVAAAGAAALPVLTAALPSPSTSAAMPVQLGPIGIDPGSFLPGGEPFITYGRKKYRRMNPLNPRALKRAIRRAEGFEKFAKKTMSALVKPGGGRKFKRATSKRS